MIERIFFGLHYSFIFHPVYMYVRYRSMTLSDTCTIRCSWTLHAVPGLPVVAWGERGNILLARSFHAAHYDRDSSEKSAWKYRGNIVRWTWILQRFNEERNPFLVCGKMWLIITFRCVYCTACLWHLHTRRKTPDLAPPFPTRQQKLLTINFSCYFFSNLPFCGWLIS